VTTVAGLQERLLDGEYLDRTRFDNVTGSECDARYGAFFVTADKCDEFCRMNLYQRNSNGFSFQKKFEFEYANGYWIEDSHGIQICAVHRLYSDCLCETLPSQCQVQSSTIIIAIVIATYLFKIVFIALTLWHLGETTMVTIGNAIQSFIAEPDLTTADCCLMSRHNVNKKWEDANSRLCERYTPGRRGSYSAITSISGLCLMVRKSRSSL
jgi:hypothetical protein